MAAIVNLVKLKGNKTNGIHVCATRGPIKVTSAKRASGPGLREDSRVWKACGELKAVMEECMRLWRVLISKYLFLASKICSACVVECRRRYWISFKREEINILTKMETARQENEISEHFWKQARSEIGRYFKTVFFQIVFLIEFIASCNLQLRRWREMPRFVLIWPNLCYRL